MADRNRHPKAIRDFVLKQLLPDAASGTVAPATIGLNQEVSRAGKVPGQFRFTPAHEIVDRKGRGIRGLTTNNIPVGLQLVIPAP